MFHWNTVSWNALITAYAHAGDNGTLAVQYDAGTGLPVLERPKGPQEALKFIRSVPFEADAIIWKTLLSISKIRQDVGVEWLRSLLAIL
ncbi:hypothetical protein SEVIR_9G343750v4 [Setaria viridis]|uniref:Uncharacterized protein n=1 Tax=Setaria viridis TaxID=4556 RepID=A0A4U6TDB8_SETVI|nr:hypothetical protein SEVIR_9G343750v2 [Setaria viridis]